VRTSIKPPSTPEVALRGYTPYLGPSCRLSNSVRLPDFEMERSLIENSDSTSSAGGEWLDLESDEGEQLAVHSLFDDEIFPDARLMLEHCKSRHSFDFIAVSRTLGLDFHGSVKLINFSKPELVPAFGRSRFDLM
jgi:hypothetical protein